MKGVQRREKLQSELASRTGNFFLLLMQQIHKKLTPGRTLPRSVEEVGSISMLEYLSKSGGYRNQKTLGLIQWILGHAVDAAAQDDFAGVKEIIALLAMAIEQANYDNGEWSVAYLISLHEEPPIQLFQERAADQDAICCIFENYSAFASEFCDFDIAAANAVGPPVTAADVADLDAYSELLSREACRRKVKRSREVEGDQLHLMNEPSETKRASLLSDDIFICFKSLFQGDHGGVEFATASHESVLQSQGLLSSSTRLVANSPFRGGPLADGLVIDDYFAISREPRRQAPEQSAAARCFSLSQAVYKEYDLIGSPQKDVTGEKRAKVIGAEINSNDHAARRGITSVGSPIGKRLSLSWVTFQVLGYLEGLETLGIKLGWNIQCLLEEPLKNVEAINKVLQLFGRRLYEAALAEISKSAKAKMLEERTQAMACEAALREGAAERLATAARPSRHSNDSLGSDGQPQG
ncbi:Sodium channel protein 60E [Durusdinium trenchii]|uniref:Sodium channel protein 60E n=1 Tax=Durusdinium trenchii TaxID=1381693 RepID=A0ABP0MR72_9DINO